MLNRKFYGLFAVFIFCTASCYGSSESTVLEEFSGSYSNGTVCKKELRGKCEPTSDSSSLTIKKKSEKLADVEISHTVIIQVDKLGPQPYYCDLEGVAELKGNELIFLKDGEGYPVNGLHILLHKKEITVLDHAEAEHVGFYCGEHVSLNNLKFYKKK